MVEKVGTAEALRGESVQEQGVVRAAKDFVLRSSDATDPMPVEEFSLWYQTVVVKVPGGQGCEATRRWVVGGKRVVKARGCTGRVTHDVGKRRRGSAPVVACAVRELQGGGGPGIKALAAVRMGSPAVRQRREGFPPRQVAAPGAAAAASAEHGVGRGTAAAASAERGVGPCDPEGYSAHEGSARRFAQCYAKCLVPVRSTAPTSQGVSVASPRSNPAQVITNVHAFSASRHSCRSLPQPLRSRPLRPAASTRLALGGGSGGLAKLLGPARSPRRQAPGASLPEWGGAERRWWCGWEEGGGRCRKGLGECYLVHFGDRAPRFRRVLRELRRKSAEKKAAAAAMAAPEAPDAERWQVPTLGTGVDKAEGASGGGNGTNLREQADGVMQLEAEQTADVTVVARVRPFLRGEARDGGRGVEAEGRTLRVGGGGGRPGRVYSFDTVVGEGGNTGRVFEKTGALAVKEVARGVSAVVFAFGQTGSGKTHTMMGGVGADGVRKEGVAAMTFEALSTSLRERAVKEAGVERGGVVEYSVECSMLQVYMGGVYDLLSGDPSAPLRIRKKHTTQSLQHKGGDTCELCPAETALPCKDTAEFSRVLARGLGARVVRASSMNRVSSRSHCIVTLVVRRTVRFQEGRGGRDHLARLMLVDLAGNEREAAREGQEGEGALRAEGIDVNKSLAALSSVLRMRSLQSRSLGAEGSFRGAALTRLLQEPLASAKIFFVPCVSPLRSAGQASSLTLSYASIVKSIRTDAEESAVLLERDLGSFPIEFVPHSSLVGRGAIARSDERATVYLNELRAVVIKIFVSHRWLKPSTVPSQAHPDAEGNPKHKLLCAAVQRMVHSGWIRGDSALEIVDWIDFSCIDQDAHNPAEQLNGTMGRIIGTCDLTITPVHDPQWREWANAGGGGQVADGLEGYGAVPFQEYLKRGWCRLEMFFTANMPFDTGRARLFGGRLADVMRAEGERRRPHLVYGTREDSLSLDPLILRKLEDEEFANFHPGEGYLFDQRDSAVIGSYVEELFDINAKLRVLQDPGRPPDVFLSYQWGQRLLDTFTTQELVRKYRRLIEERTGLRCWLDMEGGLEVGANHLEQMTQGVRNAEMVVIFLSDTYCKSQNCRREFDTAVKERKIIIPVLIPPYSEEEEQKQFGWTGPSAEDKDWWKHAEAASQQTNDDHKLNVDWSALSYFSPIDLREKGVYMRNLIAESTRHEELFIQRILKRRGRWEPMPIHKDNIKKWWRMVRIAVKFIGLYYRVKAASKARQAAGLTPN